MFTSRRTMRKLSPKGVTRAATTTPGDESSLHLNASSGGRTLGVQRGAAQLRPRLHYLQAVAVVKDVFPHQVVPPFQVDAATVEITFGQFRRKIEPADQPEQAGDGLQGVPTGLGEGLAAHSTDARA